MLSFKREGHNIKTFLLVLPMIRHSKLMRLNSFASPKPVKHL
jgi:hypothetical protein